MAGAFLVAFFETFGGAFLIIGVVTRFWAAGLAFAMLIAVTMVHLKSGMFGERPRIVRIPYKVSLFVGISFQIVQLDRKRLSPLAR